MQQTSPAHTFFTAKPVKVKPDEADSVDLVAIARTIWRGRLWIMLCMALALVVGGYRAFVTAVPIYRAETQMALQISVPPTLDLQSIVMTGFSGDAASINTEMAVVTSGELVGRLVDELHLDQDPEFNGTLPNPHARPSLLGPAKAAIRNAIMSVLPSGPEGNAGPEELLTPADIRRDVIEAVRGALETDSNYDTYVFTISVVTTDPDKSALIANTLARLYSEDQVREKIEVAETTAVWLSGRVSELRAELDNKQSEIADLRARSALVSDESVQALNQQAIELRAQLAEVTSHLGQVQEQLAKLWSAAASGSNEAKAAAAQDGQLDGALREAASGDPAAQLRFDRRFTQIQLQTEAERERGEELKEDLQRQVDDLSEQFAGQSADLLALEQVQQDVNATQLLYETFLTRLKEATAQQTAGQADSRLLTEASPGERIAPRRSLMLVVALMAGLIAGVAIVLVWELLQNTYRTAEQVEQQVGRPVLGQIPRVPTKSRPETIAYLQAKPTSAAAEAVRNLRTSILMSNVDRPPQVIMTTSSVPAEGKTTVTIALALNLAGMGKRALLIEGDIRRRTFNNYFGAQAGGPSLLSVVSGQHTLEEAVLRPEGMGFDVLMGDKTSINAADVFASDSFQRLIERARSTYDYVIIDTPPVLIVPDARVIARVADSVIYLVHWDRTTRTQVDEGMKQFRSVNIPVTGLVLSQIAPKLMKAYGYGGHYGPYSRYAEGYYDT